jgi:hypothetical protein
MIKASLGVALALALPMAAFATTTDAVTSTKPPTNLKKVGDHWTPWDPPVPVDGEKVYVIVKGDNLWDLAQRDLDDPYLWPQIWDLNRYVLDSHWIYPGDPLIIPGPVTVIAEETMPPDVDPSEQVGTGTEDDEARRMALMPQPDPSGQPGARAYKRDPDSAADHSDLMCSGYILPKEWQSEMFIYATDEEHKSAQATGDVMYMNKGLEDGVKAGDKFYVVHQENKVKHPITGKKVGYYVRKMAVAQVLVTQANTATIEIVDGCGDVRIGYDLIAYSELTSPKRRDTGLERYGVEDNGNVTGHVLYLGPEKQAVGEGDIVYLDLGQADGLGVGDYLMVYRDEVTRQKPNEAGLTAVHYKHKSSIAALDVRKPHKGEEIPRKILGEVIVLAMNDETATAKVMYSWREIYPGDQIQLLD